MEERKILNITSEDLGFVEKASFIDSGDYYYLNKLGQCIPKQLITGTAIYDVFLEPDEEYFIKGSFEDGRFVISTSYGDQETIFLIFIRGLVHLAFDRQPYNVPKSVISSTLEPLTRGIFNVIRDNEYKLNIKRNIMYSKSLLKIPESVIVNGVTIEVDRSYDKLILDGEDLFGLCDYYAKKIFIVNDEEQKAYSNETTFLHELFHTILYHMGVNLKNKDHEEVIVEQLALYILQLIRMNNIFISKN